MALTPLLGNSVVAAFVTNFAAGVAWAAIKSAQEIAAEVGRWDEAGTQVSDPRRDDKPGRSRLTARRHLPTVGQTFTYIIGGVAGLSFVLAMIQLAGTDLAELGYAEASPWLIVGFIAMAAVLVGAVATLLWKVVTELQEGRIGKGLLGVLAVSSCLVISHFGTEWVSSPAEPGVTVPGAPPPIEMETVQPFERTINFFWFTLLAAAFNPLVWWWTSMDKKDAPAMREAAG